MNLNGASWLSHGILNHFLNNDSQLKFPWNWDADHKTTWESPNNLPRRSKFQVFWMYEPGTVGPIQIKLKKWAPTFTPACTISIYHSKSEMVVSHYFEYHQHQYCISSHSSLRHQLGQYDQGLDESKTVFHLAARIEDWIIRIRTGWCLSLRMSWNFENSAKTPTTTIFLSVGEPNFVYPIGDVQDVNWTTEDNAF